MKTLFKGLSYNFKAFDHFSENKDLWKYVLIPLCLNLLVLVILSSLYISWFDEILMFLSKPVAALDIIDPQGIWDTIKDGFYWVVRGFFRIFVFLLSVLALFVLIYFVSSLVNAPFYELLSERVLIKKGLKEDYPFEWKRFVEEWAHSMKIELFKFLVLSLPSIALVFLSWVPVVGFAFTVLSFVFVSWYFAFGVIAFPMVLLRKDFKEILQFGRQNKALLVGFGLPALVPVFGIFLVSFQVVGGTLLYIEKQQNAQPVIT